LPPLNKRSILKTKALHVLQNVIRSDDLRPNIPPGATSPEQEYSVDYLSVFEGVVH